jgi:hypothetical protein
MRGAGQPGGQVRFVGQSKKMLEQFRICRINRFHKFITLLSTSRSRLACRFHKWDWYRKSRPSHKRDSMAVVG